MKSMFMMGGPALSGEPKLTRGGHGDMFSVFHTTPSASMKFYNKLGLREAIAIEAGKWPRHVFRHQTVAQPNFRPGDAISHIRFPVLILHGTNDVVTSAEVVQVAVDGLPNARLQMLEGVNHFPQTENPELVNGIIEQFMKEMA